MKIAEFLKGIDDKFIADRLSESQNVDINQNGEEAGIFIPPLQQKIELLKKAVGVDNVYSDDETVSDEETEEELNGPSTDDQLTDIKRIAGIISKSSGGNVDDETLES